MNMNNERVKKCRAKMKEQGRRSIQVVLPNDVIEAIDNEAKLHNIKRSQAINIVMTGWVMDHHELRNNT